MSKTDAKLTVFIISSGSEIGIFRDEKVNIMVADGLAPCVTMSWSWGLFLGWFGNG